MTFGVSKLSGDSSIGKQLPIGCTRHHARACAARRVTVIYLTHGARLPAYLLPIHDMTPGEMQVPTKFPPPYLTALVVDDERISRHVASRMLRELGLRVLEADGAEEALDVFRISQHPIDLVLLDVVMPETDGVELAERILAHRPGQPIVFMSAYPAEVLSEHGLQDLDVIFLAKPYTMDELLSKVRQAMPEEPAPMKTSSSRRPIAADDDTRAG